MNPIPSGAAAVAAVILLSANSAALAHGWAGQRFFPATILTDDPFVADEISLPQVSVNPPGPDGAERARIVKDQSVSGIEAIGGASKAVQQSLRPCTVGDRRWRQLEHRT